ncbi:hypothetical protein Tco_0200452 [Tanacetum coccineum]
MGLRDGDAHAEVAQRKLEVKQLEGKPYTDFLVNEQVYLGAKVRVHIMETGVPGHEGTKGAMLLKGKKVPHLNEDVEDRNKQENNKGDKIGYDKKAQEEGMFTLKSLTKEIQGVTITDCHAGNPCELEIDLTAKSSSPIIEGMYGQEHTDATLAIRVPFNLIQQPRLSFQ